MDINFGKLHFTVDGQKIFLRRHGKDFCFSEVQVCGEPKDSDMSVKMVNSSEGHRLKYVSHTLSEHSLTIIQRSELIKAKTVFTAYDNTNAIRVYTEIENITGEDIVLEDVSAFVFSGLGEKGTDGAEDMYFTRFTQSQHAECQPRRFSFAEYGLFRGNTVSQKRISFANIGSWSTKEALPQGIIENSVTKEFIMFQIESNRSWYYEISDCKEHYYLYLGGANLPYGGWSKALTPGESYRTVNTALAFGTSLCDVLAEMTKYRRQISGKCATDTALPAIFNEYMHLSWDSPTEENTKRIAPIVAKTGVTYYVIDCGWHNEEDGDKIYPYVGQWKESHARFPHGIRATTDFIRSLGMKAGLWIEPEIIGIHCKEMLDYYDDDCFMQRSGKRLAVMGRHFLDFRAKKVIDYMNETIRRMVEDYGADYIKFDYNQDCGVGTDYLAFCAGEGLEQCAKAYLSWVDGLRRRFPDVLFETCSSGGMRMDYETLSKFSIVSTSDQTSYKKYPYIAGNILSGVLPEQAAVWSYPVDNKNALPGNEQVIMNMINSLIGRMHLASDLSLLTDEQLELVKEGVRYYVELKDAKKRSVPYLPLGFTRFGDSFVASGFKADGKTYLAVWSLGGDRRVQIPLNGGESARCAYPKGSTVPFSLKDGLLTVDFTEKYQARFFEIS